MNNDIWKADTIEDLNVDEMTDGHLVSVIEMFEKRKLPPRFLGELKDIATKRGIDLNDKYAKENKDKVAKEKRESVVPERIWVLYDADPRDKTLTERIITIGRTTLHDLFTKSNVLTDKKLNHHPFIVFRDDGDAMNIVIVHNAKELDKFGDETKVMVQWKGKWNSDFFHFTVGDLRNFLKKESVTIDDLIVRKQVEEEDKKRKRESKNVNENLLKTNPFFDGLDINE